MIIKNLKLSEKIIQDLKKANWTPNRQVLIDDWKKELKKHGLEGHILADNILSNLGGLKIDSLIFDPIIETSLMFEELKEINDESNFNFFPIGVISGEIMIAVEEEGKIFGMMSDIILRYGKNLEESFNRLLDGKGDVESLGWDYEEW